MSRDWRLYWNDILESCRRIRAYTRGLDQAAFASNSMVFDAVVRNIEIIGEAAKSLPPDARNLAPTIEWKKIAGTRDVIAHAYYGVDPDTIWTIVTDKIPELLSAMESAKLP